MGRAMATEICIQVDGLIYCIVFDKHEHTKNCVISDRVLALDAMDDGSVNYTFNDAINDVIQMARG
jgi:hypothetical protein